MDRLFRYEIDAKLAPFWLPFAVRPARDGVTVSDGRFRATFGFLHIETSLVNITGAHVTTNYRWWAAAGARRSFADDGLTFGTTAAGGVCVHFDQLVPSPLRRQGHAALTVTVADREGLVAALTSPSG